MSTRISARLRDPRTLIWLGLLIIALTLVGMVVRVYGDVRDLQVRLSRVEQLTQGDNLDLAQARGDLSAIRADLADIGGDIGWLFPVCPLLGWLPQVGGDVAEMPPLFYSTYALVAAADIVFDAWAPLVSGVSQQGTTPTGTLAEQMIGPLAQQRAQFARAKSYLDAAAAYRAQVRTSNLSARVSALLLKADRVRPLVTVAINGGLLLPQLLGADGARTYLLIAQNEEELRATGGYISAVGTLTVERGKILSLDFMDAYAVDDLDNVYPPAPAPLETYMLAYQWLFRDGNWSPDFPTSARTLAQLYERGQYKRVDGVIALDQEMVRLLVVAIGPIDVTGATNATVTGDNLVGYMRAAWSPKVGEQTADWAASRKNFIGALAKSLQARLLGGARVSWVAFGRAVYAALRKRHLLIYLDEPTLAPLLASTSWDGALRATDGDYLMVVDSNFGFNKANALVDESLDYAVTIEPDPSTAQDQRRAGLAFSAHATLTLHYQHHGSLTPPGCVQHTVPYDTQISYNVLMNQCYLDFLRLYVPQGSTLRAATREPIAPSVLLNQKGRAGEPEQLPSEAGKGVWATLFFVAQNSLHDVRFKYDLPRGMVSALSDGAYRYTLLVQKQPGTLANALRVTVTLPRGAMLVRADGASVESSADGARISYALNLASDASIELVFRP